MAVNLSEPTQVYPVKGIRLATAASGIRYQGRDDLALLEINPNASVAVVFTKNKFSAAPVQLAQSYLAQTTPRYFIVNAGNANAGTGQAGLNAAEQTTQMVAHAMDVAPNQVLPFSTGVIGEVLDASKIKAQLDELKQQLSADKWLDAAKAIMTTDTVSKVVSEQVYIDDKAIYITGICKGSGMIQPNMATMLAYIATDLKIEKDLLKSVLTDAVDKSFNSITVDSDTSTNDACALVATGTAGLSYSEFDEEQQKNFLQALYRVMQKLAQAIIRDGEGASKFVEIKVMRATDVSQARSIAYLIANSPLVKTALSASDPNWGRIMAAAGKCEDASLDLSKSDLYINQLKIMSAGNIDHGYSEDAGKTAMQSNEIEIMLDLHIGESNHTVWTTDLTHEYVSINADYRS